jgi:membrane protein implicated in regulation of membrane protease activity
VISVGLFLLLSGLVLGVFAMLHGTARRVHPAIAPHERRSEHDPASEPSPLFNVASLAAFTVGTGLTAYLVARHTDLPLAAEIVIAVAAGSLLLALQSLLLARWAIPSARAEQVDHRYLLQGTIGRVTHEIPAGGRGMMRYELDEQTYDLAAQSVDGKAMAAGSEVVIDRVEDGVAHVESWAVVEQRL